jgi:hypothetical protein
MDALESVHLPGLGPRFPGKVRETCGSRRSRAPPQKT